MNELLDTADIAELLELGREYVTDKVTKREDFPTPAYALSRKKVKWRRADVEEWIRVQAMQAAGRSVRPSRGSTC